MAALPGPEGAWAVGAPWEGARAAGAGSARTKGRGGPGGGVREGPRGCARDGDARPDPPRGAAGFQWPLTTGSAVSVPDLGAAGLPQPLPGSPPNDRLSDSLVSVGASAGGEVRFGRCSSPSRAGGPQGGGGVLGALPLHGPRERSRLLSFPGPCICFLWMSRCLDEGLRASPETSQDAQEGRLRRGCVRLRPAPAGAARAPGPAARPHPYRPRTFC